MIIRLLVVVHFVPGFIRPDTLREMYTFYDVKNYWWGRPLLPEILSQNDRVGASCQLKQDRQ